MLLMADDERHGELIYSECGKFRDMENGEKGFHALTKKMLEVPENEDLAELDVFRKLAEAQKAKEDKSQGDAEELRKGLEQVATVTE
jgi:hypothetical protein